ncbi:MAG: PQQ-dependent sugar dehydrogenase, partial [Pirellulaceae bacterium]|nr:PQQ-dependent sugar dehydrogenase [Pirellulaceae bacterium]
MTGNHHAGRLAIPLALAFSLLVVATAHGQSGIDQRTPWETSRVEGTPDPPLPYMTRIAFPNQQFLEPLATGQLPGMPYLLVLQRPGQLFAISSDRDSGEKHLVLETGRTSFGVAAHPDFPRNGFIYVMHVMGDDVAEEAGSRVSRYTVARTSPFQADLSTEQVIIEWPRGGHNGGCLRFGPDGYLYISTGDGSGIADQLQTGQKIDDLLGSLLRIDVDNQEDGRHYAIPKDNPFTLRTGIHESTRPEIYSFGHRQLWKYSFD